MAIVTFDASMAAPSQMGSFPAPNVLHILNKSGVCTYNGMFGSLTKDTEEEIEPVMLPAGKWIVLMSSCEKAGTFAIGETHDDAIEYANNFDNISENDTSHTINGGKQLYLSFTPTANAADAGWSIAFMEESAFLEMMLYQ